jgi:hypothetical protein
MKPAQDLTLKELRHLSGLGCKALSEDETLRFLNALSSAEFLGDALIDALKSYHPKIVHTCPQCLEVKEKKELQPFFTLDKEIRI